jgi:tetratricopeptide (TPR) repeat protein
MGSYSKAQDYFYQALRISEKLQMKNQIAAISGNIGSIYYYQKDYHKAVESYNLALKIYRELNDPKGAAVQLMSSGLCYMGVAQNTDDSLKSAVFFEKGITSYRLAISENPENKFSLASIYGNIGLAYSIRSESAFINAKESAYMKDSALYYFNKALLLREELGALSLITSVLGNLGHLHTSMGNYSQAEELLKRAITISDSIRALNYLKDQYEFLKELYLKKNDPEKALEAYKHYITIRDSLFNDDQTKKLIRLELDYEFDKKEAVLKEQNEAAALIAAEESKRQILFLLLIASVAAGLVIIATIIFRSFHITKKQKKTIEEQKKIVEEKQQEILDSIYYAKRIQQSMLPAEKYIEKHLKQNI